MLLARAAWLRAGRLRGRAPRRALAGGARGAHGGTAATAADGEEAEEAGAPAVAVRLAAVEQATPTVRRFRFAVANAPGAPGLAFRAGQWVDFFAPGVERVGGYSICSTPAQLARDGTFDLAVKESPNPVAQWLHAAGEGAEAEVRPGGTFTASEAELSGGLLFVAGGIGITPLYSILRHAAEARRPNFRAHLLYSAEEPAELALAREIDALAAGSGGAIGVAKHVTGAAWRGREAEWGGAWGPVGRADLAAGIRAVAGEGGGADDFSAFVCGPPAMTDAMVEELAGLGVPEPRIRFERWW